MRLRSGCIDWVAVLIVVMVALMLATLSVLQFNGYNSGMLDIGNMSQSIWSATQGYPLEYTREDGNVSRLGWHAEFVYFALAGLYALLPDPRTLLVFQALWFALGAVPAYRIASRRFRNPNYVRTLMLVYLLYPTAHTATLFDLHGDTLAMPCLMFALDALDREDWWRYVLWTALALLCKIYVAVPLVVLGAVLYLRGHRRLGGVTAVLSLAWFCFLVLVVRPAFSPLEGETPARFQSYVAFYFQNLSSQHLVGTLGERLATAFLVLMPAVVFGRYAWHWLLPGLATTVPALLSIGEGAAYDYRFHHYALPVPFFVMAVVVGIDEQRRRRRDADPQLLRKSVLFQASISLLFFVLLVDMPLNPRFWLKANEGSGITDTKYGQTPRDRLKDAWLAAVVPPDVPIASSDLLAPHLINRRTVYQVRYTGYESQQQRLFIEHLDEVDYVVVDALHDLPANLGNGEIIGGVLHYLPAVVDLLDHPDFALQESRDGLLLFGRSPSASRELRHDLQVLADAQVGDPIVVFGDRIELLEAYARPLGNCRYSLRFAWTASTALSDLPQLMAVSRLGELDNSRYPHLQTMAYPTHDWQSGAVVVEEFEVSVPDELLPGIYHLWTGWYDSSLLESRFTDARSRIGEECQVLTLDCSNPR